MTNMRNLNSKESIGVTFKYGVCAKLCLNLWFESDWYFCNINESGWFWKGLVNVIFALLDVYFNDMQINKWLHLSINIFEIPPSCDFFRRRIDQKNFLSKQQATELCDSQQNIFCFEFPIILKKCGKKRRRRRRKKKTRICNALCFLDKGEKQINLDMHNLISLLVKQICILMNAHEVVGKPQNQKWN